MRVDKQSQVSAFSRCRRTPIAAQGRSAPMTEKSAGTVTSETYSGVSR